MSGPRQPIQLIIAKGKKNLTKSEIEERLNSEVQPCTDGIAAPSYLTSKQKKDFDKIAGQLSRLGIMGETDCDTLARYIVAQGLYEQAVKDLRQAEKQRPKSDSPELLVVWADMLNKLDKRVDRYYKQATGAAGKLGLTISDRCKLVVPKAAEPPKENKFSRFGKAAGSE
jgi:P27 family predicted phage terminase small subunit